MAWLHSFPWHWFESLAMVLFWALVIVLALAPINYLREQLNEQMEEADPSLPQAGTSDSSASPSFHGKT